MGSLPEELLCLLLLDNSKRNWCCFRRRPLQGPGDAVDEYLARLRRLRWQAMAVRGGEDEPAGSPQELDAARRLTLGVQELGEEEMGRLAEASRAAGLEPLFLTALKLGPRP